MAALAQPVELVVVVAVAGVVAREEIAGRVEGGVEAVPHAAREHVPGAGQEGFVVQEEDPARRRGQTEDLGGERHLAQAREAAAAGLHLAVIGARAAAQEHEPAVRAHHDAVPLMVEGGVAARIGDGLGERRPHALVSAGPYAAADGREVVEAGDLVADDVERAVRREGHALGVGDARVRRTEEALEDGRSLRGHGQAEDVARALEDEEGSGDGIADEPHRHLGPAGVDDAPDGEVRRRRGVARPVAAATPAHQHQDESAEGLPEHPSGYPATTRAVSSIRRWASSAALASASRNAITSPGVSTE